MKTMWGLVQRLFYRRADAMGVGLCKWGGGREGVATLKSTLGV